MSNKKIAKDEENFAARVNTLRRRTRLKQKELASKLGITASYLSELESGLKSNPSRELIQRICSEFSVQEDWLLGRTNDGPSSAELIGAVRRKDWPYAFSVAVELMDDRSLSERADQVMFDANRSLRERVDFGAAVLEELDRRGEIAKASGK